MTVFRGASGRVYTEGNEIAKGGEGSVCEIVGCPDVVAKLYLPEKLKDPADRKRREQKILAMLSIRVPVRNGGILYIAWPQDALYDGNGQFAGFVMPKISGGVMLYDIQRFRRSEPGNPSTREVLRSWPEFNWKYDIQIACNLSWMVAYVHSLGIVIGDLNQKNIYVDPKSGAVILVDCDSFDIRTASGHFPCDVAFPELLPPELQNGGPLSGQFSAHTDEFMLAVHIFRLLMRNADPFSGISSGGSVSSAAGVGNPYVINGECPYVRKCSIEVPGWVPEFSELPASLQALFRKTFDYTALTARGKITSRARAEEWRDALLPLALPEPNANYAHCRKDPHHVYPAHVSSCPWCRCESWQPPVIMRKPSLRSALLPAAIQNNGSGRRKKIRRAAAARPAKAVLRKPALLYALILSFGAAGGFLFRRPFSLLMAEELGSGLSPLSLSLVLALLGLGFGFLYAGLLKFSYMTAARPVPWLLLSIPALILAPVSALFLWGLSVLLLALLELLGAILVICVIIGVIACL